jgi:hypothetical protein
MVEHWSNKPRVMGSSPIGTTFGSSVAVNTAMVFVHEAYIKVFGWPSGLRRWFKAPVSSGTWVRIPLRTLIFGTFWSPERCGGQ